jgi:hypothetical protein
LSWSDVSRAERARNDRQRAAVILGGELDRQLARHEIDVVQHAVRLVPVNLALDRPLFEDWTTNKTLPDVVAPDRASRGATRKIAALTKGPL